VIESVREIADAVLYEGFLLFPYHRGALKNQMPYQFGVVMPSGYADPSEPSAFRTEFGLICQDVAPRIFGVLRFLEAGEETVEREVSFEFDPASGRGEHRFACGALQGIIAFEAERRGTHVWIALDVRNETRVSPAADRNAALPKALVSAHLVLEARGGTFISLIDPPQGAADLAARCTNERFFPVLAGPADEGSQTSPTLLASPIVLYDFPKVAQASRGPNFDASEIDELLSLSVAALGDEERAQARATHPEVARMVDRAEMRAIAPGWRVRVRPRGRADVWDGIVDGKTARVVDVKTDVDGKQYVGVLFDDDPASEMHEWYGRSFFYGIDEVEPLK